jgi:fatty acid desaturase
VDPRPWDASCPTEKWRHSHNYLHHTYTNIIDKDRDLGYGVIRISETQPWTKAWLGNPLYAVVLALFFDQGIMFHDVEVDRIRSGEKSAKEAWTTLRAGLKKAGSQSLKDYVLWPALTGPLFVSTLAADATANTVRSLWAFIIIFCGHFPAGTHEFTEAECEEESRGHWYFRQLLGSSNIKGGRLFHIMSGNLSFQIEHHLFPDLPARRYKEISGEVKEICTRYGLPYQTGRLSRQFGSVVSKIVRLAFPPKRRAEPIAPVAALEAQPLRESIAA